MNSFWLLMKYALPVLQLQYGTYDITYSDSLKTETQTNAIYYTKDTLRIISQFDVTAQLPSFADVFGTFGALIVKGNLSREVFTPWESIKYLASKTIVAKYNSDIEDSLFVTYKLAGISVKKIYYQTKDSLFAKKFINDEEDVYSNYFIIKDRSIVKFAALESNPFNYYGSIQNNGNDFQIIVKACPDDTCDIFSQTNVEFNENKSEMKLTRITNKIDTTYLRIHKKNSSIATKQNSRNNRFYIDRAVNGRIPYQRKNLRNILKIY